MKTLGSRRTATKGTAGKISVGSRIISGLRGLRDAVRSGELLEDRFTVRTVTLELQPRPFDADTVRRLRLSLGASQAVFARILGVTANTVQSWEQGLRVPSPMACRFLEEIERNSSYWHKRLRQSALSG